MNIIIVNDDGAEEVFYQQLVNYLKDKGHKVLSVTPIKNQSGVSSGITMNEELVINKINDEKYEVAGTPVDCAITAIYIASKKWNVCDVFISGINRGLNYGNCIIYSGTIAAARQACSMGLTSISISARETSRNMTDRSLKTVMNIINKINKKNLKGDFLNLNIDNKGKGVVYENEYSDAEFNLIDSVFLDMNTGVVNMQQGGNVEHDFEFMFGLINTKFGLSLELRRVDFLDDIAELLT